MNDVSRHELANELAKVAIALDQGDSIMGCVLIAVHTNGTSTELLVPPGEAAHVQKLMFALDRLHFRARVACYLQPQNVPNNQPPPEEVQ